jgi:zinc transport system ATP-binding protein
MSSPILQTSALNFAYQKERVLEDIALDVYDGDFLAIIGPNGGGKSTLLKLILGLLPIQSGQINLFGKKSTDVLNQIGYVPQNTNINTDFPIKVIEVVLMGDVGKKRSWFGYSHEEIECAKATLKQVGMLEYSDAKIGSLSGGQRQRVMIARALCTQPKLLILDEPTASIDIKGQTEIYQLLKELNQKITIIVVSHDLSIIVDYATKVAHINKHLSFHDISCMETEFHSHGEHFCEVELLELLGGKPRTLKEECTHCQKVNP